MWNVSDGGESGRAGYRGLLAFCDVIAESLEPHERRIARVHFGDRREVYAILPRSNLKTGLAAKIGLHHLLTVPEAAVTIGAARRDQARICFERMRALLRPLLLHSPRCGTGVAPRNTCRAPAASAPTHVQPRPKGRPMPSCRPRPTVQASPAGINISRLLRAER